MCKLCIDRCENAFRFIPSTFVLMPLSTYSIYMLHEDQRVLARCNLLQLQQLSKAVLNKVSFYSSKMHTNGHTISPPLDKVLLMACGKHTMQRSMQALAILDTLPITPAHFHNIANEEQNAHALPFTS